MVSNVPQFLTEEEIQAFNKHYSTSHAVNSSLFKLLVQKPEYLKYAENSETEIDREASLEDPDNVEKIQQARRTCMGKYPTSYLSYNTTYGANEYKACLIAHLFATKFKNCLKFQTPLQTCLNLNENEIGLLVHRGLTKSTAESDNELSDE